MTIVGSQKNPFAKAPSVMTFSLVADAEADLANGKISVESPIGKGILGKEVGDITEVVVPNGVLKLEILEISR